MECFINNAIGDSGQEHSDFLAEVESLYIK